ncbi:MAG: recombinase family protein [Planctomycetota bacterium]|nr:recombinase family protein [Planctomycetota bacterium]
MRAVAYIRVSTEAQASEGVSLEAQEAKVRAYCLLHDMELVRVFTDAGVSGKRASNRPALQEALASVFKGDAQALVVYKLDRLARNTVDALTIAEQLDKAGVSLHSLTEKLDTGSAMGRFFFTLVASLAEMERGIISERTAAAHAHKRAKGEATGHAPFGFRLAADSVTLLEDDAEQETLAIIHNLAESGYTQRGLVAELNRRGIRAKKGGTWNRSSLRSVLATMDKRQAALR